MSLQLTHVNSIRPHAAANITPRSRAAPLACPTVRAPAPRRNAWCQASLATPPAPLAAEPGAPASQPASWVGYLPHSQGAAVLSATGCCNGRPKVANQDSFLAASVMPAEGAAASVIGVYDGHGRAGHVASARVKDTMAGVLEACARQALAAAAAADPAEPPSPRGPHSFSASNLGSATALSAGAAAAPEFTPAAAQCCLEGVFARTAEAMAAAAREFMQSGTTAVVCMLLQDSVVAAWAGDSRAVVGRAQGDGSYAALDLSKDHKPNDLREMSRILAAGGRIARVHADRNGNPAGPYRVFLPAGLSPGLSVARAFGDLMLSQVGVIPTPDVAAFPLTPATAPPTPGHPSHVLIVATDGLWEFVDSQSAVEIAAAAASPQEAAAALLAAAEQQWEAAYGGLHRDDITVAVVFL